ncbi:N-acetylmuramoyl-L-alanine amidase [Candidatus Woesearchaeota archaeon]|nr:N-acetylmuramoyl-L-alanine amidase [Candidatus Woesearchaeota archaeon]
MVSKNPPVPQPSAQESLQAAWDDAKEWINRDLAYVWKDEVKQDYKKIESATSRIAFIFRRLKAHHLVNRQEYTKELHDLKKLLSELNNIEPKQKWVDKIDADIMQIIDDLELGLSRRKFLRTAGRAAAGFALSSLIPNSLKAFAKKAAAKTGSTSMKASGELSVVDSYSRWNNKRPYRPDTKYIILHTTEGGGRGSLESLKKHGAANYMVDTDGKVCRIIHSGKVSNHAGRSMWGGLTNLNYHSIGIEVVGYYDRPINLQQINSLRLLLYQLQIRYKINDYNVLTHSMVAYGSPNRWHPKPHRGRKKCGLLFADHRLRKLLGLDDRPKKDPDVPNRLVIGDPVLAQALYGTGQDFDRAVGVYTAPGSNIISSSNKAWDIARAMFDDPSTLYIFSDGRQARGHEIADWSNIPSGTMVKLNQPISGEEIAASEESFEGFKVLGVHGKTPFEIAGSLAETDRTIYLLENGWIRTGLDIKKQGRDLRDAKINFSTLAAGTRMLVGYIYGGRILSGGKSAGGIAGSKWNDPSTYYILPYDWKKKAPAKIFTGDDIGNRESSIPNGIIVVFKE